MIRFSAFAALIVLASFDHTADPAWVVGNPVAYQVEMTTKLRMPAEAPDEVRVWHALPTPRPWSKTREGEPGATKIKFHNTGKQEFLKEKRSHHILFADAPKANTKVEYVTSFRVLSAAREFRPEKANVTWADYAKSPPDVARVTKDASEKVNKQLASVADGIKNRSGPAKAVLEFCVWIERNIKYDAGVQHAYTDVEAILKTGLGHCGHQQTIFTELCKRVRIPVRGVAGLNLYAPDGIGPLTATRPDYTNIHSWAEVYLPNVGWVEVDPGTGAKGFTLPANLIQNNPWFQNYAVWIRKENKDTPHVWEMKNGSYTSPFALEHLIKYQEVK